MSLLSHIFYFSMQSWNVISVMANRFEFKLLNSNYYHSIFSYWKYCLIRSGLSLSFGAGLLTSLTNSISLHYSALSDADLKGRAGLWQKSWVYFCFVTQTVCETLDKSHPFFESWFIRRKRHYYRISVMIFPFHHGSGK